MNIQSLEAAISLLLLQIASMVALLLWGVRLVRVGFIRAFGSRLRQIIKKGTRNRVLAFFSGMTVTALLQSSTATALLVTSFARSQMVGLTAALAVMLGADVGTTLVAQVLSFDLAWLMPFLIILGIAGRLKYDHAGRARHISSIILGLGLILLSLTLVREASLPIKNSETLPLILAPLEGDVVFAILISAILTWLLHSSLAAVLLFATMCANGIIPLDLGILLILGANLGGALVPFIATYKEGAAARQITFANILMRLVTIIVAVIFIEPIFELTPTLPGDTERQLLHFHTGFNLAVVALFIFFIGLLSKLMEKLFPKETADDTSIQPLYLDNQALSSPVVALAGAARETMRISETVEFMLDETIKAFEQNDKNVIKKIRKADNDVDTLYKALKLYMTRLSQEGLDPKEADRYIHILTFATNLEHVGDIIENSLMDLAEKKQGKDEGFSKAGFKEIKNIHEQVLGNLRLAQAIFMSEDPKLAADLIEGKNDIREAADETAEQHFKRLGEGLPETIATSSIHLDIVRDYRRINSYITRVAYAILENTEKHKKKRKR